MSGPVLSVGQVADVLDGLRAKGDDQARALGRDLVSHLRRSFPGRSFSSATSERIARFEEDAALFAEIDSVAAEKRKLQRQIETTRAETARLRHGRCERTVDAAIRRGVISRDDREETVRQLEAGDESLRCALDPNYTPPMPDDVTFARQFEATHGFWPEDIERPAPAEDPERQRIAREVGLAIEEVL